MQQIILDLGSGNSCKNNLSIVERMIDTIAEIDKNKVCILKWQLFENDGINEPLKPVIFNHAYSYAKAKGFKTTASVSDFNSLWFLLQFEVPFIKLPNDRKLDWLIGEVPRKIPVYVSYGTCEEYCENISPIIEPLACISRYPATIEEYEKEYSTGLISRNCLLEGGCISDHTAGLELYKKYHPQIWEKHFVLEYDSNNLDGGTFAMRPRELEELLKL